MLDSTPSPGDAVWSALLAIAGVQAVVLAFALPFVGQGRSRRANRYLAALFVFLTIDLLAPLLVVTGYAADFPYLMGLPGPFLVAPMYYFYARAVLDRDFRLRLSAALHLIPAAVIVLRNWSFLTAPKAEKVAYIEALPGVVHNVEPLLLLPIAANLVQILVYVIVVDRLAVRRGADLARTMTSADEIDRLVLLRVVNFAFVLFVAVGAVICGYMFVTHRYTAEIDYILVLTMCSVAFAVSLSAVRRPRLFTILGEALSSRSPRVPSEVLEEVHAKLLSFMKKERPFLQQNLKIGELARQMSVPQHHISQALSTVVRTNFNDFINQYRVQEAQRLLREDQAGAFTYSAIATDVGFTSRASFYRAFKRIVGTTPSEYIRGVRGTDAYQDR